MSGVLSPSSKTIVLHLFHVLHPQERHVGIDFPKENLSLNFNNRRIKKKKKTSTVYGSPLKAFMSDKGKEPGNHYDKLIFAETSPPLEIIK